MGPIVALAGGVGAAKLLRGLIRVLPPGNLVVIGNVGDDFEFHGLHVSPDLDIVMYTLAGAVDDAKGWGIAGDTFQSLQMLGSLGFETWFNLGDKDLAVQVVRNGLLKSGLSLSGAVAELCRMLGVEAELLPVTDDQMRTVIISGNVRLDFQEYFVKRGATDKVANVVYEGCETAKPAQGVLEAIETAEQVIVCPSNPILSINPILSVPGVRSSLTRTVARIVGVSPIIGGKTIRGPAANIMSDLGLEVSPYGVAKLYQDFLDHLIIDDADVKLRQQIESLGVKVTVVNTIMGSVQDAVSLASTALKQSK